MENNNATTEKTICIRDYEKNCPQKFRAFVEKTLGYKDTSEWSYDDLADEFGYSYMRYWTDILRRAEEIPPVNSIVSG